MNRIEPTFLTSGLATLMVTTAMPISAEMPASSPVTVDNFRRAESDLYFAKFVKDGAFGKFIHARTPVPVEKQDVIRMNRDTLYSYAVVDLDASDVTVTMPDPGSRFMGMQVINEDHYTPTIVYQPGPHVFTKSSIGTRYVLFLVRTFVDPGNEQDLEQVHALQDSLWVVQSSPGLGRGQGSAQAEVDPVQHLLGTTAGWGGNPRHDAFYAGVTPEAQPVQTRN